MFSATNKVREKKNNEHKVFFYVFRMEEEEVKV